MDSEMDSNINQGNLLNITAPQAKIMELNALINNAVQHNWYRNQYSSGK